MPQGAIDKGELERQTINRVYRRLIPLIFVMMFFNYLDRINLGYAGLTMNKDLGLSPAIFGFAASIFFLGYMVVEVPSNLMLHWLGARVWLARILISWGLVATITAFVWDPVSLYVMRFGLGVAEAGFMPGVVLFLTYWFPSRYRARAVAGYIIAGAFSAILGGPISTTVMTWFDGAGGLHGWQWMFVVEGVPTILLGFFTLYYLTDRPSKAEWLTREQAEWLEAELAAERAELEAQGQHRLIDAVLDARVWLVATLFGCALVGIYGMFMWLPQIIKSMGGLSNIQVGFLSAVPPLLGVVGTILVSISSDKTGDRKFHLAAVYCLAALGMLASAYVQSPIWAYIFLCIAGLGLNSGNTLFWSINASLMTGAAGATAIALVNTIAQFGGLIGPWCIGLIKDSTGSFSWALTAIAGFLVIASAMAAALPLKRRHAEVASAASLSTAH